MSYYSRAEVSNFLVVEHCEIITSLWCCGIYCVITEKLIKFCVCVVTQYTLYIYMRIFHIILMSNIIQYLSKLVAEVIPSSIHLLYVYINIQIYNIKPSEM